jgi:hypothetical protein
MKTSILGAIVLSFFVTTGSGAQDATFSQRAATAREEVEVLTRGPVHEAFAETITFDPEGGALVPKLPPAAIEELPPNEKPEGDNVNWIPGYWAWDDEREDFLWVSGIWRSLPPGRQWVPGYWNEADDGAQWISGYWADAEVIETEYLPEPPATMEAGPNIEAPSVDHHWLPGCWIWHQNRYAWRPGYWAMGYREWTWIPAHYIWTPRGCIFVDGYYDYDVDRRGIVYAPVLFDARIYTQRRYSYSPTVVISPAVFITHLFVRPSYGHYYFGDYYGTGYGSRGFSPWFSFNSNQYGYDPFYAQQRWVHRHNQQWRQSVEANYLNYRNNEDARPPRTWQEQRTRIANSGAKNPQQFVIAAPLAELAAKSEQLLRVKTLDESERQQIAKSEKSVKQFRDERQQLEAKVIAARPDPSAKQPSEIPGTKAKLPKSPIVANPLEKKDARENEPPKRETPPPPDRRVEPKSKKPRQPEENLTRPKTAPNDPKVPRKPIADQPKESAPKTEKPKAVVPNPQKPRTTPPSEKPPKQLAPKTEPPKERMTKETTPKNLAPKNPPPKVPSNQPEIPKGNPPNITPKKEPPSNQPKPKQGPPKGKPPKDEPKEKGKGETDKPK